MHGGMAGPRGFARMVCICLAVAGSVAAGAQAAGAPAHLAPMRTIANWSGYVATHQDGKKLKFKEVTGTWTVPAAKCVPGEGATASAAWVGIGGYTTTNQEEVGTNSNCDKHGKPVYFAWFELVPYLSYQAFPNISHKVYPGDTITGTVQILNYRFVRLKVQDQSRNWTFLRVINFSSQDVSTADWIVESPATCVQYTCQEASLTNFKTLTMRGISAVGNGAKGTLATPSWKVIPVRLVPTELTVPDISPTATATDHNGKKGIAKSPAGATPGAYSSDGSQFSINWVPLARKPV